MAGSRLDASYDRWRKREHAFDRDKTYNAARNLQEKLTPDLVGGELTTLKWAKAYLQVRAAQAREEVDRLEAEQKFFRSLVVIAAIFAAHFVLREQSLFAGAIAAGMSALSYLRFRDRRWAMTEFIFATAVIVEATGRPERDVSDKGSRPPAAAAD